MTKTVRFLSYFIFSFFMASQAFADSFVELIVVGKAWPEHKWGHVSLRIKNDSRDNVYDFGRYGAMWGSFDTEGEPILRVWKSAQGHLNSQKKGNPTIHVVRFNVTERETLSGFKYFDSLVQAAQLRDKDSAFSSYKLSTSNFHAVNNNCVTTSVKGFMTTLPYFNVNIPEYAKGDGLYAWARPKANNVAYNKRGKHWDHIWWPQDLLNLLQQEYVSRGFASVTVY